MSAPIQPHVRWAQRKAFLFIKIDVPGSKPQNSKFNITEKTLDFEAEVEGKKYSVHLDFFKEINPQVNIIKIRFFFFWLFLFFKETKTIYEPRYIELRIFKKEKNESYWPRLMKDKNIGHNTWLTVDWQNFIDEDMEGKLVLLL